MPWTPDSDSRLQAWFKADALNLVNNDPVATWTGSEQSRDLTQATAGFRPLFKTNVQNSLSGVLFDGVDDYLDGSYAAAVPQPRTLVVLAKSTVWQSTLTDSAGGSRNIVQSTFDGMQHELRLFAGVGPVDGGTAISTSAPVILTAVFNGTSGRGYVNGVPDISANLGSDSLGNGPRFGANLIPGNYFSGYLFEILDYAGALSETDLAVVGIYLADKWGLTWSGAALPPTKGWTAPARSTVWDAPPRSTVWTA